jgi:hypothetical protein
MKDIIKNFLRKWLEVDSLDTRVSTIEKNIYHKGCALYGFAVLKKHLQRPDGPLPHFMGKEIEQD